MASRIQGTLQVSFQEMACPWIALGPSLRRAVRNLTILQIFHPGLKCSRLFLALYLFQVFTNSEASIRDSSAILTRLGTSVPDTSMQGAEAGQVGSMASRGNHDNENEW